MTLEDIHMILKSTDLPVAYLAFPADRRQAMPFIVFQETGSNNFGADNRVWHSATRVQVDLLTRHKDRATEKLLETTLTDAGIYWERVPEFDSDEDYFRVTYEIEI